VTAVFKSHENLKSIFRNQKHMCWSGEASAVLATVGLSSTGYFFYKKEPPALCITLGYFSLMEALQAYTYTVIDDCADPRNQIATLLGYLHIAWEIPAINNNFLFNMYSVAAFLLPTLYGSWKMTLYQLVTGPFLAYLTTSNPNEWAAVWCLYSIGFQPLRLSSRLTVDAERSKLRAISTGLIPIDNCVWIKARSSSFNCVYFFPMQHFPPKKRCTWNLSAPCSLSR
jgi:hypothetical protein